MSRFVVLLLFLLLVALTIGWISSSRGSSETMTPRVRTEMSETPWEGEVGREPASVPEPARAAESSADEPETEGRAMAVEVEPATLHGYVYDNEGVPVEGALVRVDGPDEPRQVHYDAMGYFEVRAIDPGTRWVGVRLHGGAFGTPEHMLQLSFEPGERREHDFGSALGTLRLFGILRSRSGDVVRGGVVHASRADDRAYRRAVSDEAGRYELRVEPGHYDLSVSSPVHAKRHRVASEVEVSTQDRGLDLELPGSTLEGRVVGLPVDFDPHGRGLRIAAHLEGHDYPSAFQETEMAADGSFRLEGLAPGTWKLGTWPELCAPAVVVVTEADAVSVAEIVAE